MLLDLHPDIRLQKLTIGAEQQPLLVIDNFVGDADKLVRKARTSQFTLGSPYFPGIRVEAPQAYRQLIVTGLRDILFDYFQLRGESFRFPMCHYSLVTTPAAQLAVLQRIPHFDSLDRNGLATVHYLFKRKLGGTAFYRHRKTGFEYVDESRREIYFKSLAAENEGPDMPAAEYING